MITIVDYNAGNLRSVQRACDAVGAPCTISGDSEVVARASRIIFPGVGAAASAMQTLRSTGLGEALSTAFANGVPILGICLGTQVILDHSEEGDTDCLGLLPGRTKLFRPQNPALKVPHMGWNAIEKQRPHPLLEGIDDGDEFYFVHSYYPHQIDPDHVLAQTEYEVSFCSVLCCRNLFATQFHPEKSGRFGLRLIENFTSWNP